MTDEQKNDEDTVIHWKTKMSNLVCECGYNLEDEVDYDYIGDNLGQCPECKIFFSWQCEYITWGHHEFWLTFHDEPEDLKEILEKFKDRVDRGEFEL